MVKHSKSEGWGWIVRLLTPFFSMGWLNRWLVLAIFFVVPLSCFMHFTHVRMEMPEVGTKSAHYIVSEIDFSFLDREATQALRQEATRDISTIYRIGSHEVGTFRQKVENSLVEKQKWRTALSKTTFDELYTVLESIQETLIQERFTDARTLKRLELLDEKVALLYELPDGELLPAIIWSEMRNSLIHAHHDLAEPIDYLLPIFAKHSWKLKPDFILQEKVQKEIRSKISDQYTRIDAGIQMIKKGEVITQRHIQMLQAMKAALESAKDWFKPEALLSSVLLALSLAGVAASYLYYFHRRSVPSFAHVLLIVFVFLLTLGLAKGVELFLLSFNSDLVEGMRFPLLMPLPTLLLTVLVGTQVATSASFFLLIIMGVSLSFEEVPFLLINFVGFALTILFARKWHRRRQVFSVCGKVFLGLIPTMLAINLGVGELFEWNMWIDLLSNGVLLLFTAVIALLLLPFLESGFGILTDMSLMDYMDPDQELLKRLSLEAPGTYQHSLVVGHIAEAAANAVGANGLFCRAATLYHDIGKLFNPHYFTENQLGGLNIHQLLTPLESTKIILAHVVEGEALARKHGLPQCFIDVIREHHGTTRVHYFYCKQVELTGGDPSLVDCKSFRYPGPKPRSKESAIIMLADSVEAASRSLSEVTERALTEIVNRLAAQKAEDGQLDECQLTFEELGIVKKAMVKSLVVTSHLRIKYPESP